MDNPWTRPVILGLCLSLVCVVGTVFSDWTAWRQLQIMQLSATAPQEHARQDNPATPDQTPPMSTAVMVATSITGLASVAIIALIVFVVFKGGRRSEGSAFKILSAYWGPTDL